MILVSFFWVKWLQYQAIWTSLTKLYSCSSTSFRYPFPQGEITKEKKNYGEISYLESNTTYSWKTIRASLAKQKRLDEWKLLNLNNLKIYFPVH